MESSMFDLPSASGSVAGIGAAVRRALEWPAHVIEARRTLAQLARMTDRELIDIGLTRQDLCDCSALSLDDDPSEKLARERATRAWLAHRRSEIVQPPRRDLAA
jgi:uncharacterized protein YjiS (DUF1127 family)